MNYNILFDAISERFDKYLSLWVDICNIESPSRYKAGVDAVADYVEGVAREHGWKIERFPQEVAGDILTITMNPDADAAPLTLSAHTDTVHRVGSFGEVPVHIEGDRIYGPGVADCKGGIPIALLAMDALESIGFTSRPITLILQSDEEVGSYISNRATIDYICERAQGSVAFLNLEPHNPGGATISRKGIVNLTFTVTGQAAHSSLCAKRGANAIIEAAHKMLEFDKIKEHKGITCNCSVISGGTVTNVVPEKCEFQVNVRYATAEQLEWILDFAEKMAEAVYVPGCTTEFRRSRGRAAMPVVDRNTELLDTVNRIFAEAELPVLVASMSNGGSDAAEVTIAGIPCLDTLGAEGGAIHSTGEYASVPSLLSGAKRIAAIALAI